VAQQPGDTAFLEWQNRKGGLIWHRTRPHFPKTFLHTLVVNARELLEWTYSRNAVKGGGGGGGECPEFCIALVISLSAVSSIWSIPSEIVCIGCFAVTPRASDPCSSFLPQTWVFRAAEAARPRHLGLQLSQRGPCFGWRSPQAQASRPCLDGRAGGRGVGMAGVFRLLSNSFSFCGPKCLLACCLLLWMLSTWRLLVFSCFGCLGGWFSHLACCDEEVYGWVVNRRCLKTMALDGLRSFFLRPVVLLLLLLVLFFYLLSDHPPRSIFPLVRPLSSLRVRPASKPLTTSHSGPSSDVVGNQ